MLCYILPCLNEEKGLETSLKEIRGIRHCCFYGIVVVDGGSTDGSREVAKKYGAEWITAERGYGTQYRKALRVSYADAYITGDSDGTYPFQEAYGIYERLVHCGPYEFINTDRLSLLDPAWMCFSRRWANWLLTAVTNILFGLNLRDSQSGMWIFTREALDKITLTGKGMELSEEIKIEAFKKCHAAERAISYRGRIGKSHIKFKDGINNILFLFRKALASNIQRQI